jgi:hypothetical protein
MPWPPWSRRHPDIAAEAEAGLDAQLARLAPNPRIVGVPTIDRERAPIGARTTRSRVDLASIQLIRNAVAVDRVLGRSRAPSPDRWPPDRGHQRSKPQITDTLDAGREAQLPASGVSGTTSDLPVRSSR